MAPPDDEDLPYSRPIRLEDSGEIPMPGTSARRALEEAVQGLYGIVDLPGTGLPADRLAYQLLAGGARTLQIRMKGASAAAMLTVVDQLLPLCRRHDALLLVNDRLDVALAGGADGAHLGQDDLPLEAARRVVAERVGSRPFYLGISTHDEAQAVAAANGGADYIGFGPCFATASKALPDPVVGLEQLAAVCRAVAIPVVAIGGVTVRNVSAVAATGARAAAAIGAVNRSADILNAALAIGHAFPRR